MARSILAVALAAVLSVAFVQGSLAAVPPSGQTIQLQGEATVTGSRRNPQLLMSADGGGYHLDATLSPTFAQPPQGRRGDDGFGGGGDDFGEGTPNQSNGVGLQGDYTLTGPNLSPIDGQASGYVSSDGTGTLNLTDSNGNTLLSGNFLVDGSGNLQIALSGQLSTSQSSSSSTGQVAGSSSTQSQAANQSNNHLFWYVARAAGLSAYLMLFLNIVLGLAVHTRFMDALVARWRSFDLHEFTGLLAMGFLALHALALLGDQYVGFSLRQILVPMESTYRPFWTALGIVGFYMLAVVTASSYLRRHIGYKSWKAIHMISYGAFFIALVHGVAAGTDTTQPWAWFMYWSTGSIVMVLTLWRFGFFGSDRPETAREQRRSTGGAG